MPKIEILGLVAALLTTTSFIPQVYKAWKEKSTKDISLTMYLIFLAGLILWAIYGYAIGSLSVMVANGVTILLVIAILLAKFKFK